MAQLAEIVLKATDEASKVLQEFEGNATKSLGGAEAAAEKSAAGLAMIATAATAAVGAAVALGAAFAKSLGELLTYAEALDKANQSTSVSVEFWQKLIKTGAEMNISFDSIRGAVERLEKNFEGSGTALAKFGINVQNFKDLQPDEAVRRFAFQVEAIQDPMEKTAILMAATGKSGAEQAAMWHAIAIGAVDAQKALGQDMVAKLLATDNALDGLKTSMKNLVEQLVSTIATRVPFEGLFNILSMGFKGLGNMLAAWPGIWEAVRKGAYTTASEMFKAAVAAGTHEKASVKLGKAQLNVTEQLRLSNVAMTAAVKHTEELAKAADKSAKEADAHAKKMEANRKASIEQLSKEAEASRKAAEAELKQMKAEEKAEEDLTAKTMAAEAKRLDAVQKTREKEAEAAGKYFEGIIENGLRANETEIQGARRVLEECIRNRDLLVANVEATNDQITRSDEAMAAAQKAIDDAATKAKVANLTLVLDSASSILTSLFGKSKKAAIAGAIIDTISAIVKTMAAYPFPWSLIPAAAAAVAGYAQVKKIQSSDAGFAAGTPGTAFMDFGTSTPTVLHGQEAVVTRPQGESVASMVRDAIRAGRADQAGRGGGSGDQAILLHLDGQVLGRWMVKRNRAGLMPLMAGG